MVQTLTPFAVPAQDCFAATNSCSTANTLTFTLQSLTGIAPSPQAQASSCVLNPGYLVLRAPETPFRDVTTDTQCAVNVTREYGFDHALTAVATTVNGTAMSGRDFIQAFPPLLPFEACGVVVQCLNLSILQTTAYRSNDVALNVSVVNDYSPLRSLVPSSVQLYIGPYQGYLVLQAGDDTDVANSIVTYTSQSDDDMYAIPLQRVIPTQPDVGSGRLRERAGSRRRASSRGDVSVWYTLTFNVSCDAPPSGCCITPSTILANASAPTSSEDGTLVSDATVWFHRPPCANFGLSSPSTIQVRLPPFPPVSQPIATMAPE